MARYQKKVPLIGASGSIGNLITYDLNGVQVVRRKPSGFKKREISESEENHRISFKEQHRFAKSVKKQIIDRIWTHVPVTGGLNAYNLFIKTNTQAFGGMDTIVLPELLILSRGDLSPALNLTVLKEDKNLRFTWSDKCDEKYSMADDRLNIAVLINRNELLFIQVDAVRSNGSVSFQYPDDPEFTEGYVFWSSKDDERFSPSLYWSL